MPDPREAPSPDNDLIAVEFYGLARHRAGTREVTLKVSGPTLTLGDLWQILGDRFPQLVAGPASFPEAPSPYSVNLDGQRFIEDAATLIQPGQTVLILSADAGG